MSQETFGRMRRLGQVMAVLAVLVVSAGIIYAGGTPEQKCAAAKNKAASKKIASKLRCYQKAFVAGKAVDPACLMAAENKFNTTIPKIENKGGCVVNGDANAIEGTVDTCVNNIVALTPVTPTTATTTTTMPCSGTVVGGYCWFKGIAGQSCNDVCSGASLTYDDNGTRGFAGSDGSAAFCQSVLDALSANGSGAPLDLTCSDGFGCETSPGAQSNTRVRCKVPTTNATAFDLNVIRMCACK